MALERTVRDSLARSIELYRELVELLPEEALGSKLPDLPSNTIGQQLWCVVGARESYARGIEKGEWAGFDCSLGAEDVGSSSRIAEALRSSGEALLAAVGDLGSPSDVQKRLVVDVLEHEIQHHGQLIRFLYGLRLPIPSAWKARYALG